MKLGIIQGSTRPSANSTGIASWVSSHIAFTHPEVAVLPIPLHSLPWELDPFMGQAHPSSPPSATAASYVHPAIQAFSATISSCDALLIVTPQYNWSVPAPLKNAIDQLYWEWRAKPIGLFTFGGHGGGKCADALQIIFSGVKARLAERRVAWTLPPEYIMTEARIKGTEDVLSTAVPDLEAVLDELKGMLGTSADGGVAAS